ncbi:hypothetical protein BSK49_10780 [Paenibacillus odorifer]|uniref:hypothetical protein n=1 Tax=Paenibacillus TaxID=44249 RepID=UPI00096E38BC|nr:hypothetical protein [Paenibacillus odorifer]OMD89843.1 hypothetical protein BSK49_10780 [Paenibacillus odorifer]
MILQMICNISKTIKIQLESTGNHVLIKENTGQEIIITGTSQEILKSLLSKYQLIQDHRYVLIDKTEVISLTDGILCLYTTYFSRSIFDSLGNSIDITFAHAFPLSLASQFRDSMMKILDEVIQLKQLVLIPSSELVLVDTKNCEKNLEILNKKYNKLLKKNDGLVVKLTRDLPHLFDDWKLFCNDRFDEDVDNILIDIFKKIYIEEEVTVKEFWLGDECMCRCLLYYDHKNKIVFDIIAPWNMKYKKNRPGIYSLLINIIEATSIEYKYCLCYGEFPYKQKILEYFPRIRLDDLSICMD